MKGGSRKENKRQPGERKCVYVWGRGGVCVCMYVLELNIQQI